MNQTFRIPPQHEELWRKLQHFDFDQGSIKGAFVRRLAKEQRWKESFALLVIDEYRKFLFLMKTAGHMVTPSLFVDQAWHLHLIYTVSYWERLCLEIFNQPMHHSPGDGSNEDKEKFAAIYARTLDDYTQIFGTPPKDIWGSANGLPDWRIVLARFRRPVQALAQIDLLALFRRSRPS